MKAQRIFEKKKSRSEGMKNPKISTGIILLLFLFLIALVLAGESVSTVYQNKEQEKEDKGNQAASWNQKGKEFYEKEDYKAAIECLQKAVEIDDTKVDYLINLAQAYRDDKKFVEAEQLLDNALEKFIGKEGQKNLQIELADVHFLWGENLISKYKYVDAIKHYKYSYRIDEVYRPEKAAIESNDIGYIYYSLSQKQEAFKYYEIALNIRRTIDSRTGEAATLNNIGILYDELGQKQKALEYYEKALRLLSNTEDQGGEADILNNIGHVYEDFGRRQEALEYYEKSLNLRKAIEDQQGEAASLNDIGHLYYILGRKKEVLEYYEKALSIRKAIGDRAGEAISLSNIGTVYLDIGRKQKALEYHKSALSIDQSIGNRTDEATTLHNIGYIYDLLGQKQKSLEYYQKTLKIWQAIGYRTGEATTLNNIGYIYNSLGQKQETLEYYNKALSIWIAIGGREGEGTTLTNIGNLYDIFGLKKKALKYFKKALPINRAVGDREGEASTLDSIGSVYDDLGQPQKALDYYKKALLIRRAILDRAGESITLNNIGILFASLNQNQKAREYYEKSLLISLPLAEKDSVAATLSNLMFLYEIIKNIRLSIFFGKYSINLYQKLRANISGLKRNLQKGFLESNKKTYRKLTDILIVKGEITEAQQVLDMLKEEEVFDYIKRDSSVADVLSMTSDYTRFERNWLDKYIVLTEKFAVISNEYHALKFKINRDEDEEKQFKKLDLKLKEEITVFEKFLAQMREAFDRHEKEIQEGKIDPDAMAKEASALQKTLKHLDENQGGKHAALHYMVYEGRISVILTTASFQSVKQTDIDEQDFNRMIMAYRNLMMRSGRGVHLLKKKKPDKKIRKYEKYFYDLIFKPVDEELKKYGAANLVVSLDGVLRYLPLGALWDGNSYLLQRYRIAIVTPYSLKNIEDEPIKEKKILGLGAGRGGEGFYELPNVGREIRSIVLDKEKGYEGLITGKALIDDDFTKENLLEQLKNKTYSLVHIASHFRFSPGDETKNRLLLGDGTTLKLSEIRRMGKIFENVKLLVLSACQTGVGGNGEEVDGFGELAQQSGAKSVIASLWPVADESTTELMITFYSKLKEGKVKSKIEALRQAQLELAGLEDLLQKDKTSIQELPLKKTKYSHPYYWGPFILMGNWR